MNTDDRLKMSFDPHTIEHLGIQMYSVLPNAIAELIANAYDADASYVRIKIRDTAEDKSISVIDDGVGMSFDEINNCFLRIGRKRREDGQGVSRNKQRKVTGRKGLGKLAFFGIGDIIKITTKQNGKAVSFTLSWPEIMSCKTQNYEPSFNVEECGKEEHGTTIILSSLKRKSGIDLNSLAISLSKLFNFFDESFKVYLDFNNEPEIAVDSQLRYNSLDSQIIWQFPGSSLFPNYLRNNGVKGKIIATRKPLKPGMRGITLFAHGRLVNAPEFFDVGESSHGYSYLTGWLDVDFIDEQEDDVISTDRQSLNWDLEVTSELRNNLNVLLRSIEKDWREKRKLENRSKVAKNSRINVEDWYGKLPTGIKDNVERIVSSVVDESEMTEEKQSEVVGMLHTLIPEYAYYHWRHIHNTVQNASYTDYQNKDYYRAVEESIKRYEATVQSKSGRDEDGAKLMNSVFGKEKSILSVSSNYKKSDGGEFCDSTKANIEEGQKFLSSGMMSGVRNPLAHEEIIELNSSGLFSEDDCLDMLSLLSHLFRRLDHAVKKQSL